MGLELERFLNALDWSSAPASALDKAFLEYQDRNQEADSILNKGYSAKELEELFYQTPLVMPRLRHIYKMAWGKKLTLDSNL